MFTKLKHREAAWEALQLLKSTSFSIIYIIFGLTVAIGFVTNSNFFINTDKAGYIDALNLLASLLAGIVATTYSITIVALQLASTQFSPRVLRYFLSKNLYTQITLGVFMGWVMYCLLLKFWLIDSLPAEQTTVPEEMIIFLDIAIYGCIFLTAGLLPHFIVTIADNINVASIVRKIALHTIDEIQEAKLFWQHQEEIPHRIQHPQKIAIHSRSFGYLQSIDYEELRKISLIKGVELIEQVHDVGSFVQRDAVLVNVVLSDPKIFSSIEKRILRTCRIDKFRSYHQDLNFGIRQLVDIALKAISPAVNDPTTAVNALDYIGEIAKEIMQANMPVSGHTRWKGHNLYLNEVSFKRIINQSFDQIYHYGRTDFAVTARLFDTIAKIIPAAHKNQYLEVLGDEIVELGLDFNYQYIQGTLSQAYSFEQLVRLLKIILRVIENIQEKSKQNQQPPLSQHLQERLSLVARMCKQSIEHIQNFDFLKLKAQTLPP
ncbi:MAG: DUF2254 domain-containing protein [Microscillaceae bacterium]|nr:DUF2254 domain-containing protein [Microscillaceae bacterium]MDW8460305.1 DUF2254 family protein [Cytophagales bacterium]